MPAAAAMLPPEPVRFSTTNCWPKWSDSHWLMMRATVSTGPPAEKPIIQRTGRVGYSAAEEDEGRVARLKRQDRANIDPRQNPLMVFPVILLSLQCDGCFHKNPTLPTRHPAPSSDTSRL
jgi:hypothetical protein